MKTYLTAGVMFFLFFSIEVSGQEIINGDFEIHTFTECSTNLQNSVYTNSVSNSWAFGANSEIDLQNDSCGFAIAQSNDWFVSLAKHVNGDTDALSLEISSSLFAGNTYELSYFEFAADTFDAGHIPIEIGLSIDSISFGSLIHSSLPGINTWTSQAFSFTAPNNGKYITVRADSAAASTGWIFIDNFELTSLTGIEEVINLNTKVYPNPTERNITIESNFQMNQVAIYDLIGNEVSIVDGNRSTKMQLTVSNLVPGCYILSVQDIDMKKRKMTKLFIAKAN